MMETKHLYSTPECIVRCTWVASAMCASNTLDPLPDNDDVIEWDD